MHILTPNQAANVSASHENDSGSVPSEVVTAGLAVVSTSLGIVFHRAWMGNHILSLNDTTVAGAPDPHAQRFRVRSLLQGGAALECGRINVGDILLTVDAMEPCDVEGGYLEDLLMGTAGSHVQLRLQREGDVPGQTRLITLLRQGGRATVSPPIPPPAVVNMVQGGNGGGDHSVLSPVAPVQLPHQQAMATDENANAHGMPSVLQHTPLPRTGPKLVSGPMPTPVTVNDTTLGLGTTPLPYNMVTSNIALAWKVDHSTGGQASISPVRRASGAPSMLHDTPPVLDPSQLDIHGSVSARQQQQQQQQQQPQPPQNLSYAPAQSQATNPNVSVKMQNINDPSYGVQQPPWKAWEGWKGYEFPSPQHPAAMQANERYGPRPGESTNQEGMDVRSVLLGGTAAPLPSTASTATVVGEAIVPAVQSTAVQVSPFEVRDGDGDVDSVGHDDNENVADIPGHTCVGEGDNNAHQDLNTSIDAGTQTLDTSSPPPQSRDPTSPVPPQSRDPTSPVADTPVRILDSFACSDKQKFVAEAEDERHITQRSNTSNGSGGASSRQKPPPPPFPPPTPSVCDNPDNVNGSNVDVSNHVTVVISPRSMTPPSERIRRHAGGDCRNKTSPLRSISPPNRRASAQRSLAGWEMPPARVRSDPSRSRSPRSPKSSQTKTAAQVAAGRGTQLPSAPLPLPAHAFRHGEKKTADVVRRTHEAVNELETTIGFAERINRHGRFTPEEPIRQHPQRQQHSQQQQQHQQHQRPTRSPLRSLSPSRRIQSPLNRAGDYRGCGGGGGGGGGGTPRSYEPHARPPLPAGASRTPRPSRAPHTPDGRGALFRNEFQSPAARETIGQLEGHSPRVRSKSPLHRHSNPIFATPSIGRRRYGRGCMSQTYDAATAHYREDNVVPNRLAQRGGDSDNGMDSLQQGQHIGMGYSLDAHRLGHGQVHGKRVHGGEHRPSRGGLGGATRAEIVDVDSPHRQRQQQDRQQDRQRGRFRSNSPPPLPLGRNYSRSTMDTRDVQEVGGDDNEKILGESTPIAPVDVAMLLQGAAAPDPTDTTRTIGHDGDPQRHIGQDADHVADRDIIEYGHRVKMSLLSPLPRSPIHAQDRDRAMVVQSQSPVRATSPPRRPPQHLRAVSNDEQPQPPRAISRSNSWAWDWQSESVGKSAGVLL